MAGCGRMAPLRLSRAIVKGITAGLRKARFRGLPRIDPAFTFAAAAYNLVRLPKLLAGTSP